MATNIKVWQAQAQGSREYQQDRMAVTPEKNVGARGLLSVLCDGMGGMHDGEKFAAIGCETMHETFVALAPQPDMTETLRQCYEAAQAKACAAQSEDSGEAGGSTLLGVLIKDGRCAWISSGDSRIYLYRGGGLIQLTRDQNMGAVLDVRAAFGAIDWETARGAVGRSALTGHLGMENAQPCDFSPEDFALLPGDILMEMSDGVYNTLSVGEM